MDFLLGLISPLEWKFPFDGALTAFNHVTRSLIYALIGWGLGLPARAILKRRPRPRRLGPAVPSILDQRWS